MRFRFLYAATLLLALAPAAAQAQLGSDDALGPDEPSVVVLSERLGTVIDAHERAYFGLFPGVEGFREARAFAGEADSVRVVIAREQTADSVVVLARPVARALGRFVETFEQHRTAFYNPDWQILRPYARADVPTPDVRRTGSFTVYVPDGYYTGHPVYAEDSLLVLRPRSSRFDWRTFDWQASERESIVLRPSEIEQVRFHRGFFGSRYAALLGLPFGLAVNEMALLLNPMDRKRDGQLERRLVAATGGAVAMNLLSVRLWRDVPYEQAVAEMKRDAWFTPEARPPELPASEDLMQQSARRAAPTPRWRSRRGWIDTGFGAVISGRSKRYGFFTNFDHDDTEREVKHTNGAAMETAVALRPLPWLSTGIGAYMAPVPDPGDNRLQEAAYSKPSLRVFADLDLIRLWNPNSQLGLAVGGGVVHAVSVVTQQFPENWATTYSPSSYDLRERGLRPFYSVTIEANMQAESGVFVRALSWSAPSIEVPLTEVQSVAFPGTVVYRVDPHTVTFRQFGIVAGLRAGF